MLKPHAWNPLKPVGFALKHLQNLINCVIPHHMNRQLHAISFREGNSCPDRGRGQSRESGRPILIRFIHPRRTAGNRAVREELDPRDADAARFFVLRDVCHAPIILPAFPYEVKRGLQVKPQRLRGPERFKRIQRRTARHHFRDNGISAFMKVPGGSRDHLHDTLEIRFLSEAPHPGVRLKLKENAVRSPVRLPAEGSYRRIRRITGDTREFQGLRVADA